MSGQVCRPISGYRPIFDKYTKTDRIIIRDNKYDEQYNNYREAKIIVEMAAKIISDKGIWFSDADIVRVYNKTIDERMSPTSSHKILKKKREDLLDVSLSDIFKDSVELELEIGEANDFYSDMSMD